LVLQQLGGEWRVASLDMKRFDMHIHQAACETSWGCMRRIGLKHLATRLEKQARRRRYRIRSPDGFGKLIVPYTRASGDGDTISSNSLIAVIPAIYALITQEDIIQTYWRAGFVATGGWQIYERGRLDYDFLQRLPMEDAYGNIAPTPKPGRILSRAFWSSNNISARRRLEYCRAVVDSIRADVAHCPLLNDMVARIDELHPGKATIKLDRNSQEPTRLRNVYRHDEAVDAVSRLAERYGVTESELLAARRRIRAWQPGEFLDDTATLHVFHRVVFVDTQ
jgi:hypothetical protein